MADISTLSDEELISTLSDEDLKNLAGIKGSASSSTNRLPMMADQPVGSYKGNPILNGISDTSATIINNLADVGDSTLGILKQAQEHPFKTAGAVIGGVANTIAHPIASAKSTAMDLINKVKNAPNKPIDALLTIGGDALMSQGAFNLVKSGIQHAPETIAKIKRIMPKAYNDALVSNTVNSVGDKVTAALKPVQAQYKTLTEPFLEKPVDGETFQKVLSNLPKEMRQDMIDKYGTSILDASGRPQTNLGKLQAMELGLKEDIMQPKYGASINASSFDTAKLAKVIKDVRLSQYPEATTKSILELDKKFGPLMNASKEILPKVSNQAGVANTKVVFDWFNNPANAGKRDYLMSDLQKLGIDLKPEVSIIKGWVARQGQKKLLKNIGTIATEGTIIGKVLRGH